MTFKDLAPNLHIVSTDIIDRTVIEWNKEKTPDMSVAKAVRASCSIPVYFTPTIVALDDMLDNEIRHKTV